jgi:hypothetical protein
VPHEYTSQKVSRPLSWMLPCRLIVSRIQESFAQSNLPFYTAGVGPIRQAWRLQAKDPSYRSSD